MDFRSVVSMGGTYYISIPRNICNALEIKRGERLKVSYVTGTGIFITQEKGADKIPVSPKSIEGLKKSADFVYSQIEKKLKELESKSISDYFTSMIRQLSRLGIFEVERRVNRLERLAVESNIQKGKLTLVREHKKRA